ncbi:sulfite exporter TauE/SafE family protein [Spirulina subsalsa]|uniref:sulfite exporter TauE/SafE family protein n=1 Tax=Spirulina subsalsa TaxID=54311 RepID=UPI0002E5ABFA|nr:sulfite exporter TauE/SafE family protein [Spirulina subsalsa]
MLDHSLLLLLGGLLSGLLAGLLGIGGGVILVPILVALNYQPVQATATSTLAILLTSTSGSIQNWRMGYLDFRRVLALEGPALITAQLGVFIGDRIAPYLLLAAFGALLWLNIYLVTLRKKLVQQAPDQRITPRISPLVARLGTGAAAGLLAGLFGIGGGVIMVPFQILLLGEPIKIAIQTSLGVIVITTFSACLGHAYYGNVLWIPGLLLGTGGLIGAQISTRFLPRLPDRVVDLCFRSLLALLSLYFFWRAWNVYPG